MKRFNISEAENGTRVLLRNGENIKILCWDKKGPYPIVANIEVKPGIEKTFEYTEEGVNSRFLKRKYNLYLDGEEPIEDIEDYEMIREVRKFKIKLTLFYISIILSAIFLCLEIFIDYSVEDSGSLIYIVLSVMFGGISLLLRKLL